MRKPQHHYPIPGRAARLSEGLTLARAGKTYDEIAKALGYANRSGAWKLLHAALRETVADDVEAHRELALLALDDLLRAAWDRVEDGDPRAIDAALRVIVAQVKLLGLDRVDASKTSNFYDGFAGSWRGSVQ